MQERGARTRPVEATRQTTASTPGTSQSPIREAVHPILKLQQAIGNQLVQRLLRSGRLQAKLTISQPGDTYEQEADRVADQVMSSASVPSIRRKCDACAAGGTCPECEEEEKLHPKELPGHVPQVTPKVESSLASLRGGGQPLAPSVRAFFEPRFGRDFSQVRVHTDGQAGESARAIHARAFTGGQDVVFGAGEYAPESREGQRLLAHELTHVVQQTGGTPSAPARKPGPSYMITRPHSPEEVEADRTAERVVSERPASRTMFSPSAPTPPSDTSIIARQTPEATPPGATAPGAGAAATSLAAEDPALRARRLDAIGAARNAIRRLTDALSGGYLWSFETPTASGIDLVLFYEKTVEETTAKREARLRRILTDLIGMVRELEAAPIPSAWLAPEAKFPRGAIQIGSSTQPGWQDAQMFYAIRAAGLGQDMDQVFLNGSYIITDPIPSRRISRAPIRPGIGVGLYIVVPDPVNEPLVYRRLTPYEGWNVPGVIIEVWKDDFGYYYPYNGAKHYLPGRP